MGHSSAILGFAMLAVYVTLIVAEGNNSLFEVLPWALLMATGASPRLMWRTVA